MERRTSLRRPTHHKASLRLPSGAYWPCVIDDYCADGLFLRYATEVSLAVAADLQRHQNPEVRIEFCDEAGELYTVDARPTRTIRGAMGVEFVRDSRAAIEALMEGDEDVSRRAVHTEQAKKILQASIRATLEYTVPLLDDLLPQLEQALRDAAIKASTDQMANALMAASERFAAAHAPLKQRYVATIESSGGAVDHESMSQELAADTLSLIDKDTFEDWLTTRVLITKAETHYRALLLPLRVRMEEVGLLDRGKHQTPFGPALVVHAFQHAVREWVIDGATEKIVFRCFGEHVMEQLEPLYKRLNELLIAEGILPDLNLNKAIRKSRTVTRPTSPKKPENTESPADSLRTEPLDTVRQSHPYGGFAAPIHSVTGQEGGPASPPVGGEPSLVPSEALMRTFLAPPFAQGPANQTSDSVEANSATPAIEVSEIVDALKQLTRSSDAELTGPAIALNHFSEQELVAGLSALQRVELAETLGQDTSLYERVSEQLRQANDGKSIHEDQKVTIDVVDRFFASLKSNPRLTPEVKAHLSRLEIPVLKVVLLDEQFFDDRSSSVRAVMNRIAQLGMKGIRLSPSMQQRIDHLVQRIVEEFEHDTEVFDHVLDEFDALIDKQNELYRKNVERVAAAAEGVHKVEMARRTVAQALNQRLSGRRVPKAVVTLIDHGWKDLLNLTYVRHGVESEEWLDQLQVLDDLLDYAEHPEQSIDLQSLLPAIYQGLKQVYGDTEPPQQVREELRTLLREVPTQTHATQTAESYEVPEDDEERVRRNADRLQALKPWVLRAKSFPLGAWMQFNREMEETQYMRLVWIAPGYSKYVFVNHQGRKVVELGLFKLSEYLSDATILPDPDYETPIFNQGLDEVVRDMYDRLTFEASHDRVSLWPLRQLFCRDIAQRALRGPQSATAVLVYVRFEPINSDDDIAPPNSFIKGLVEIVEQLPFEDRLCGRIAKRDFAFFIVAEKPDMVAGKVGESLMEYCQRYSESVVRWMVAWGESRCHLGFVNSATMLRVAARPILGAAEAETSKSLPSNESAAVQSELEPAAEQEQSSEESAFAEDKSTEPVAMEPRVAANLPGQLDIYMQRSMSLNEAQELPAQYELFASVPGTGLAYEPLNRAQAMQMDAWWIELLMAREQYPHVDWESLQSVRVKLSGYSLNDDEFIEWLLADLTQDRLAPLQLWFDVYSCDAIDNVHAAADRMQQLKACGYRFCLDHFGSEQSPFPLLRMMPFDIIKIDESFIRELNQEEADGKRADSVIEVAHYLRKVVLASSVDSAICLQRMRQLKVDFVQGTTVSDFEHLLTWEVGGPE